MGPRRVVVVGAGVIGVATAHALRADGHEVTLLDTAGAAASGTSHANGGFLSAAFCAPWAMPGLLRQALAALFDRESPLRWRPDGSLAQWRWLRRLLAHCSASQFARHRGRMVRLALFSRACQRDVVAQTGVAFDLKEAGVMQLFRQPLAPDALQRRLGELRSFGMDAHWCVPEQVRALEPALSRNVPPLWGLHARDDASADCERFTQGLLAWNRARGLRFLPGSEVTGLRVDRRTRRLRAVRVGTQELEADAFVFATGVASARLLRPHLQVSVLPVKGYTVTAPVPGEQGPRRALIDDTSKLALVRMGSRVRLAGMAEVVGHDTRVDAARCGQLVRQYETLYGPLAHEGRSLWAGLRPMTPDGTPIIGATPIEGLYLNTGHGTYGWTLACGSARLLADVLAGRPTALDPAAYALDPRLRQRDALHTPI